MVSINLRDEIRNKAYKAKNILYNVVELKNRKKLHKNPCSMSFLVDGMTILPKEKILNILVKKLVKIF